jgi:hypothetical protein
MPHRVRGAASSAQLLPEPPREPSIAGRSVMQRALWLAVKVTGAMVMRGELTSRYVKQQAGRAGSAPSSARLPVLGLHELDTRRLECGSS